MDIIINGTIRENNISVFDLYNDGDQHSAQEIPALDEVTHKNTKTGCLPTTQQEDIGLIQTETELDEPKDDDLVLLVNNVVVSQHKPHKKTTLKIQKCFVCGYKTKKSFRMQQHMRTHTGEKPFQCAHCDYKCAVKYSLVEHLRIHTGERSYKCDKCDYKARLSSVLTRHKYIHTVDRPFKCKFCDHTSKSKFRLDTHFIRSHNSGHGFKCNICTYTTQSKRDLFNHKKIHQSRNVLKCHDCKYVTPHRASMRKHVKAHSRHQPFMCDECDFRTSLRLILRDHKLKHVTEKPSKCTDCGKAYACDRLLNIHRRVYKHMQNVKKPTVKCDQCDYETDDKRFLLWHRKIHTGEKLFNCKLCENRTNCSSNLTKHVKVHKTSRSTK